ncbi:MAG: HAMP domain-containing protein [Deltaproteobacteria bacterium]|uniref:histidine kinase n=1 Tax=Candidatus Zymogenus saltonus TaxID=2844893 RepID=A0A9D8KFF1_9DELT|nr:HAMP domain-containing protein [Candidatus Zymogenus saltonus]
MKKSLFLKFFVSYFFIVFFFSLFVVIFSFHSIRSHYTDSYAKDLESLCKILSPLIVQYMNSGQEEELNKLVDNIRSETDTRITIVDINGRVLKDSEEDPKLMENLSDREEIFNAKESGVGRSIRFSDTVGEQMIFVAMPLKEDKNTIGVLRLGLYLKDVEILLNRLELEILYIVLSFLFLALAGSIFFSRNLVKPIKDLNYATKKLAEGDFSIRTSVNRNDELNTLSEHFNFMTERINKLFTELSQQKDDLFLIISSMQEGVLVLDRKERILFTNSSLTEVMGREFILGKFYWEVIREGDLVELISRVRQEADNVLKELYLGDNVFLCSATFLKAKGEIVLVFHDITEMKKLENMKKDFIANVSHELRTPLTSIKGSLEMLEESPPEKKDQYLDIMKRNTERLINIIQDIAILSELEKKELPLELEEVNVKQIVEDVIKIFEREIAEKGLNLNFMADDKQYIISADPFKLEQMIINLISNAIKYTDRGEILISLRTQDTKLILTIKDTGIGIPKKDLPNIYERFYRVDKSRSRKLGGTGLGLSIVKSIVVQHKGDIKIDSTPGQGTSFTIKLNKDLN